MSNNMEFKSSGEYLSLSNEEIDFRTTELNWLFESSEELFNINLNQLLKSEELFNEIDPFFTVAPITQLDFQNIQTEIEKRSSGKGNWEVEKEFLPNNIGKFRKITISFSNFKDLSLIKQVEISIKRIGGFGPSNIYLDYTEGLSNQSTSEPLIRDTLLFDVTSYSLLPPNDRKFTFYIKTNWVKGACPKPNSHPSFQFSINLLYSQSMEDGVEELFEHNFRSQALTIKPHKWESKDNKKNGIAKPRKKKREQTTDKLTGSKRTKRNNNNNNNSGKRRKTL